MTPLVMSRLWRAAAILLFALPAGSCSPDYSAFPDERVGIKLELVFSRVHSAVTAEWNGQLVSTQYNFPGAMRTASATLPGIGDVIPPRSEEFDAVTNLHAGWWRIEITLFEGDTALPPSTCEVDLGAENVSFGVYEVRWTEEVGCESAPDLPDDEPTQRDAEAVSIAAPATATFGDSVNVTVNVRNNGELDEFVSVRLAARPPSGGAEIAIGNQNPLVAPGQSAQVNFSWNSACVGPPGNYLLEAVATVPTDSTSNNSQSRPIALAADREITIRNFSGPATVQIGRGGGTAYTAELVNGASQAESGIGAVIADSPVPTGTANWVFALPPFDLACGETKQLALAYFPSTFNTAGSGKTLSITLAPGAPIPGDDPADNAVSLSVTLTN